MESDYLEVVEFTTTGFKPLILFQEWRVATLCYTADLYPPDIATLERHLETDEVFVLLKGSATLILGSATGEAGSIEMIPLAPLKGYNVRRNVWHGVILSRDAVILLVENEDTGSANSEYYPLTWEMKQAYLAEARTYEDWKLL